MSAYLMAVILDFLNNFNFMYISYNTLKDFVSIPKSLSPEEIATRLTNHTVEVEGLIKQADKFAGVLVGKVLSVEKHPNADRLRIAIVDVKSEKLRIVCGAPNLEEGQLVPVATIGTILPGNFEIKESEIRGEKSQGMICAEDELGLGDNHEGIMVLDKSAKIGQLFAEYLGLDDIVLEVDNKSLSNRPDLLNHYGLAREISAIFNLDLKNIDDFFKDVNLDGKGKLDVKVEEKELCERYMAIRVENIEVKESPVWLKNRLLAISQKPINNIVDLTNYIMFEIGQPMHAFDAQKVNKIVVRRAAKNERIETLDEKERILDEDDLVISDGKNSLALAGVMGGKDSGISETTTSIILEAANFKAPAIRKTSQKFSLRSESSIRFEKAIDPELPPLALKRFIFLLKEICPGAEISSQLVDIDNHKAKTEVIELSLLWLNKKIGQEINKNEAIKYLTKLGFIIEEKDEDILFVSIPSWRATKDVKQKEDLVEEVLRLYGYDNIESKLPLEELRLPEVNQSRLFERKIKNILSLKHSLFEVYNYSFVSEDQLKKLGIDFFNHLRLLNPLSETHALLRQSLVPNMVLNIRNNQFKADSLGFFEIAKVFFNAPGDLKRDKTSDEVLPYQEIKLAIALAGNNEDLFNNLKGLIESLFRGLGGFSFEAEFSQAETLPAWADENKAAKISLFGQELGYVALIKEQAASASAVKKAAVFAEINLKHLFEIFSASSKISFQELPKYPAVARDLAFVLEEKIMYNEIKNAIISYSPLVKSLELFDVYVGDKLEEGKKSLAVHINFLSEEKTLTSSEVDVLQTGLINDLEKKFGAKLRDF
jgi:phenylalanyl-tRNA synthetase beta chain